jgi:hypothetical protein
MVDQLISYEVNFERRIQNINHVCAVLDSMKRQLRFERQYKKISEFEYEGKVTKLNVIRQELTLLKLILMNAQAKADKEKMNA